MNAARTEQLRQWVLAATEHDGLEYETEVMWGVAFDLDDESRPPTALFAKKEAAEGFAAMNDQREWLVAPYVLTIRGRNDSEIPGEEIAPAEAP